MPFYRLPLLLALIGCTGTRLAADTPASCAPPDSSSSSILPAREEIEPDRVNWGRLFLDSAFFLGVEHGFRLATEAGTREGLRGPFFADWGDSIGNLHGWSDGDPFLVAYIGHPIQGAVMSFMWVHNDVARYRCTEFGRNPNYWKSRLRGMAWSWASEVQWKMGPASEASIGNVQNSYPQQGFVDWVNTPTIGTGWLIAEDALDKYVIRRFEDHVTNPWPRLLLRSWLNPTRSWANMMSFRRPWYRETREGVTSYRPMTYLPKNEKPENNMPLPAVASFESVIQPVVQQFGGHTCIGGGANAAFRVAPSWEMVVDVSGCKLLGLGQNNNGDSLIYQFGPRWTPTAARRSSPYAEVLVGGHKMTQSQIDPAKKAEWDEMMEKNPINLPPPVPPFMEFWEANAFAMKAGTGVDVRLTSALAWRVANLGYMHTWTAPINGVNYTNGFQFSSGLVLRMGTW